MRKFLSVLLLSVSLSAAAQVGEFRKDLAVGVNGGYVMSNVSFMPEVPQKMLGGMTLGVTARYTCEKYFKSICAVVAEVNYSQIGWKENILTMQDQPVPLHTDPTQNLRYARKMNYAQIPGQEMMRGTKRQFFFQVGPQFGFFLSEKTEANFDVKDPAFNPGYKNGEYSKDYKYGGIRASHVVAQDSMAVENKFDYGVAVGLGVEMSNRHVGHFLVEGRYYYGLGNIYGNSKRDHFSRSNFGNIVVKFTYLFDIIRTKNSKIK